MSLSAQVKEKINIITLMEEDGLSLKPESGGRYTCRCPFHEEKTASFKVSEVFQNYRCFGCGDYGDVITYFAKRNQIDYKTATLLLAERFGIQYNKKDEESYNQYKRNIEIIKILEEYYKDCFRQLGIHHPAKQQILNRNLVIDGYEDWFGYAPSNPSSVIKYMQSQKVSLEELKDLGIVSQETNNIQLKDRLIFFIRNYLGITIGFSGRRLDSQKDYKYVNSKQSSIFDKKKALYGIEYAKKHAQTEKSIYITEGQFDVLSMHQNGYQNTIAISGTALTEYHIADIHRCISDNGKIIMLLDCDKAGQKALLKIFQQFSSIQNQLYMVRLPKGKDPCEYLQENKQLPKPYKFVDVLYKSIVKQYPLNILENRSVFVKTIKAQMTDYITDDILRESYLRAAYTIAGLQYREISTKRYSEHPKVIQNNLEPSVMSTLTKEDKYYLSALAFCVNHWEDTKNILVSEEYPNRYRGFIAELKEKYNGIRYVYEQYTKVNLAKVIADIAYIQTDEVDTNLLQSHYRTLLEVAHKETKSNQKAIYKSSIVSNLQNLTQEELLQTLEKIGG